MYTTISTLLQNQALPPCMIKLLTEYKNNTTLADEEREDFQKILSVFLHHINLKIVDLKVPEYTYITYGRNTAQSITCKVMSEYGFCEKDPVCKQHPSPAKYYEFKYKLQYQKEMYQQYGYKGNRRGE